MYLLNAPHNCYPTHQRSDLLYDCLFHAFLRHTHTNLSDFVVWSSVRVRKRVICWRAFLTSQCNKLEVTSVHNLNR